MFYGINARDYLDRAKQRLNDNSTEALFYAAFELRCGIEARMREYLEARAEVIRKKKLGWQIAKLGQEIERAFSLGDKIAQIRFLDESGSAKAVLYYTPVTSALRKKAERLGELLHVMKKYLPPDSKWWHETREYLESTANELEVAVTGTLLGPPMIEKATGRLFVALEVVGRDSEIAYSDFAKIGKRASVNIAYLDELPQRAAVNNSFNRTRS